MVITYDVKDCDGAKGVPCFANCCQSPDRGINYNG